MLFRSPRSPPRMRESPAQCRAFSLLRRFGPFRRVARITGPREADIRIPKGSNGSRMTAGHAAGGRERPGRENTRIAGSRTAVPAGPRVRDGAVQDERRSPNAHRSNVRPPDDDGSRRPAGFVPPPLACPHLPDVHRPGSRAGADPRPTAAVTAGPVDGPCVRYRTNLPRARRQVLSWII